jgi:hypothetical protein
MNKYFKIAGIATAVVVLVCNIQYAAFYNVKNNPTAAKAEWTYTDTIYHTTTVYCGNEGQRDMVPGTWTWVESTQFHDTYGYETGFYYFVANESGTMCGTNVPSPTFNYNGYEITAPTYPTYPL